MNGLALRKSSRCWGATRMPAIFTSLEAPGDLIKIVWHDGIGMLLFAKRLRGRFIWPSPADGNTAQLAYMLDGIDWRNPVRTWRPEVAG